MSIFLFEIIDKVPTVGYLYVASIVLALIVFAATYFHRQVGLIVLILVGFFCIQDIDADLIDGAVNEAGQSYINHWHFSQRLTFVLSVLLFFTAIILKRRLKQKNKLD